MKKLENLMDKGWFRIVLFLAFGVFIIIVDTIFLNLFSTGSEAGMTFLTYPIGYLSLILMYFVCDVTNNSKYSVTKFIRRLLMIISLVVYVFLLVLICLLYTSELHDGNIKNTFVAGLCLAPLMTYPLVYFFLAGKFQNSSSRVTQFILLLGANILPIILGFIIVLILKSVNNKTITTIVMVVFIALIILAFIRHIRKHGFLADDIKISSSSSSSDYSSSDYSSDNSGDNSETKNVESMESWGYKLRRAIIDCGGRNYMTVNCDTRITNTVINLDVTIDVSYVAKTMPNMLKHEYEFMCKEVERVWKKAARNCPYNSKLNFEQPIY